MAAFMLVCSLFSCVGIDTNKNSNASAVEDKLTIEKVNQTPQKDSQNDKLNKVIAGKYDNAVYFNLENHNYYLASDEWKINEAFLNQQIHEGKTIYLSHNPEDPAIAKGALKKELDYLKRLGFSFQKDGNLWKAVKK